LESERRAFASGFRSAEKISTAESFLLLETWKRESYKNDIRERMENLSATHILIAKLSGNKFYEIIINALIAITHEITLNIFKKDRDEPPHGLGKHDEIVKAVVGKDAARASELMTQHLKAFLNGLLKIVKRC
jgi:GntR family transcriptional repressor for pyruvate dehydrogenase complex